MLLIIIILFSMMQCVIVAGQLLNSCMAYNEYTIVTARAIRSPLQNSCMTDYWLLRSLCKVPIQNSGFAEHLDYFPTGVFCLHLQQHQQCGKPHQRPEVRNISLTSAAASDQQCRTDDYTTVTHLSFPKIITRIVSQHLHHSTIMLLGWHFL